MPQELNTSTFMATPSTRLSVLLLYLFIAVYLLPMFPHGGSANELSRWATAASLVEKGII